jgi:hypothetical protein
MPQQSALRQFLVQISVLCGQNGNRNAAEDLYADPAAARSAIAIAPRTPGRQKA